jgi:hypothetical protein
MPTQSNPDFDRLRALQFNKSAGQLLFFASSCLKMAANQYMQYDQMEKMGIVKEAMKAIDDLRAANKAEWEARTKQSGSEKIDSGERS